MKFLLDTDICIYLINQRKPLLQARFNRLRPGDVAVSAVTRFELQYGMRRSQFPERNERALQTFLAPFVILPFENEDAIACGNLRAELESAGKPIGPFDLQIAAQALRQGLTLVTNNVREFGRVRGLRVENWVSA